MNETKAVTSGYSYKVTVDASVSGNSFGEISVIPKADALKYFSGTFSSVGVAQNIILLRIGQKVMDEG